MKVILGHSFDNDVFLLQLMSLIGEDLLPDSPDIVEESEWSCYFINQTAFGKYVFRIISSVKSKDDGRYKRMMHTVSSTVSRDVIQTGPSDCEIVESKDILDYFRRLGYGSST